jgi:hypothetical protein
MLILRLRIHQNQEAAEPEFEASPLHQQLEQQAAIESAQIAAPDTLTSVPSDAKFMSGGRSAGDLTSPEQDLSETQTRDESNPIEEILKPLTNDTRPSLAAGQNHMSVQSISQLHVPGEFPKGGS